MCNLYSVTKGQSAIRDLFAVKHDRAGNVPPLPRSSLTKWLRLCESAKMANASSSWPAGASLAQDRPLFAFAGLWTPWRGLRGPKSAPVDGEHELFGFLTTEANAIAPIH